MIHFVVGTRAQLFKMAPIMIQCEKQNLDWRWIYTAQHKDTIQNTLDVFGIKKPDYVLFDWNSEAKTMSKVWYWFAKTMLELRKGKQILGSYVGKQHIVLTHGDTLTTWWGALLGKLNRCKVMHVESGLRSFNLLKPFPEEINRLITFRLSDYYACPGQWAVDNLKKYKGVKINTQENTQLDVLRFGYENCEKADMKLPKTKYVVATIHRYENIFKEKRFEEIIDRVNDISKKYQVLWVQHPATEEQLKKLPMLHAKLQKNTKVTLLPRLEYLQFIKAVKYSEFVITDGGGNQEELYHLGKPTLLFRNETERQEGLGTTAVISRLDPEIISEFVKSYKSHARDYKKPKLSPSRTIVDEIRNFG